MSVTESSPTKEIGTLIINSPYEEPQRYWKYHRETKTFTKVEGERRPAGYVVATPGSQTHDDPGLFVELPVVNMIRKRVKEWSSKGWPGVTGTTRRLLEHWNDPATRPEGRRFFFCQMEAIETLIWLREAAPTETIGITIGTDGGPFQRYCSKLATGSGKTIVMAMLIAWQVLNKVNNEPGGQRFSKDVLVVAPGLTVKSRLSVLHPADANNYYDEFAIVPSGMMEKLRLARIVTINRHHLEWDSDEDLAKKRTVDKRGSLSDEAYTRSVLGLLSQASNLLVINDEAHHAWRLPVGVKPKKKQKKDTFWMRGLDRIHRRRNIISCFDFTATPFYPGDGAASKCAFDQPHLQ